MYPVANPDLRGKERQYVNDALDNQMISSQGSYVQRFEEAWAEYCGTRYAVACSSGTTALTLSLASLGIGPGDEVIVPSFTMVATAWAVTHVGARPVFVDCGDDLNIDVSKVEAKITDNTKAIIPVHIYGRVCDMDPLLDLADSYNLHVVEDAAEAHGAVYKDRMAGSMGILGCFSLYANKIITSGEGGIITTDDEGLYEELIRLRAMYFNEDHTFLHPKTGYNFRMTNLQAAVALAQVEAIDGFLEKRDKICGWYDEYLGEFTIDRPEGSVLWMYDVVVDSDIRNELMDYLKRDGIETRMFFKPMEQQPMYDEPYAHLKAYSYSRAGFYLPTYTQLTRKDIQTICQSFQSALTAIS